MGRGKADWDGARERVQWASLDDWARRLADNPEAMYRVIADSYDVVLRDEEARQGRQRSGRRPKPPQVPLEQVYEAVFPQRWSMVPFVEALTALVDDEPQRSFSERVPCHQTTLSRLLAGTQEADLSMMERLARAGGVNPAYFLEWRAGIVAEMVRGALLVDPSASINAIRGIQNMRSRA